MNFYCSLFKNSRILSTSPGPDGKLMTGTCVLNGQEVHVLNGGPHFKFNEAFSFFVNCENQAEVDELWGKLTEGGEEGRCGWLKDKFGLSWQVIPRQLGELMSDPDREKAGRVMQAMLKMNKIEVKGLLDAYNQP
jgi:predicted 3-demethylubiquinone-9 3-methyltransferase (glyoxalase superfamily)